MKRSDLGRVLGVEEGKKADLVSQINNDAGFRQKVGTSLTRMGNKHNRLWHGTSTMLADTSVFSWTGCQH